MVIRKESEDIFVVNVLNDVLNLTFESVTIMPGKWCADLYLVSLVTKPSSHSSIDKHSLVLCSARRY